MFRQPSATVRYLPQMPDLDGFASVRAYVEAGLGPADDPHRATYLLEHLGLTGEEKPDELSGGEARRAALARVHGAGARHPAARRADQPSRPRHDRMAGRRAQPLVLGAGRHLARPPLPRAGVARHRLARPRPDPPARQGLCAFRGMARHRARGRGARAAQARPPDRARGALAALRRHRAAQAQHAPARRIADDAPALSRPSRRRGRRRPWPPATPPNPASW